MINPAGIDFSVGRRVVMETVNEEIRNHEKRLASTRWDTFKQVMLERVVGPTMTSSVILGFTVLFTEERDKFYAGLITSIGVIVLVGVFTAWICYRHMYNADSDVEHELKRILCEYLGALEAVPPSAVPETDSALKAGNSHMSIVTVYRNMLWQRIPSLLLVQGDIIALMAGSVTPGKVQELIPYDNVRNITAELGSAGGVRWRRVSSKVIEKGEKIFLKKRKKSRGTGRGGGIYANDPSGAREIRHDKQRTIASNSIELLHFSGDVRCFVLVETPIAAFCRKILSSNSSTGGFWSTAPGASKGGWLSSLLGGRAAGGSAQSAQNGSNVQKQSLLLQIFEVM